VHFDDQKASREIPFPLGENQDKRVKKNIVIRASYPAVFALIVDIKDDSLHSSKHYWKISNKISPIQDFYNRGALHEK